MLDFNARRYLLSMGAKVEPATPEFTTSNRAPDRHVEPLRLVYPDELQERTGLTSARLRRLIDSGDLLPPRRIHYRGRAWLSDYLTSWMEERKHLL